MSHGVMSLLFFAMTAVPVIVAISRNVPSISATKPVESLWKNALAMSVAP